jgi:hypothetical protein
VSTVTSIGFDGEVRSMKSVYVKYDIFAGTKDYSVYDQIEYRKVKRPSEFNSLGINVITNSLR